MPIPGCGLLVEVRLTEPLLLCLLLPGRVQVLNDFEAVGYGIPALEADDVVAINDVPAKPLVGVKHGLDPVVWHCRCLTECSTTAQGVLLSIQYWDVGHVTVARFAAHTVAVHVAVCCQAPKAVMGPGTGLGAAQLMWDSGVNAYKVWPGAQQLLVLLGW